jgi:hypothetical protein
VNAFARGLVPALAAWLVPSAILAVIYTQQGQNPAYGLVGGVVGLVGAFASWAVYALMHRHDDDLTDLAAYVNDPAATAGRWEHEGLRRLHADIVRDAERRRDDE